MPQIRESKIKHKSEQKSLKIGPQASFGGIAVSWCRGVAVLSGRNLLGVAFQSVFELNLGAMLGPCRGHFGAFLRSNVESYVEDFSKWIFIQFQSLTNFQK